MPTEKINLDVVSVLESSENALIGRYNVLGGFGACDFLHFRIHISLGAWWKELATLNGVRYSGLGSWVELGVVKYCHWSKRCEKKPPVAWSELNLCALSKLDFIPTNSNVYGSRDGKNTRQYCKQQYNRTSQFILTAFRLVDEIWNQKSITFKILQCYVRPKFGLYLLTENLKIWEYFKKLNLTIE